MNTFPPTETQFLLPGPSGQLEILASPAPAENQQNITGIICHPHPLFGGTMTNKVVSTIARAFKNLGVHSVRFNFRGVGKSEGKFDEGRGELEDLMSVIQWVKKVKPEDTLWLAGFSFGGFIAATAATKIDVKKLLCVAPQVSRFPENFPEIHFPWFIVQGEEDEIVSPEEVYAWVEKQHPQPQLIRIKEAGHFFHGKLVQLREELEQNLRE